MRLAIGVEYDGTNYFGWQYQPNLPTVQNELETALSKMADQQLRVHCAGRTDEGVHALAQVAHFDTTAARADSAWVFGTNSYLPHDIRVKWVREMPEQYMWTYRRFKTRPNNERSLYE